MLSFPSLSLSPTHSLSPSLSLAPTLSIVFISLISEYQLIPNPDADFRFVRPARSSIGFSHQCAISDPNFPLTSPTTLNMHIWDTYEMDRSCNILPPKHTLLSLSFPFVSLSSLSLSLSLFTRKNMCSRISGSKAYVGTKAIWGCTAISSSLIQLIKGIARRKVLLFSSNSRVCCLPKSAKLTCAFTHTPMHTHTQTWAETHTEFLDTRFENDFKTCLRQDFITYAS